MPKKYLRVCGSNFHAVFFVITCQHAAGNKKKINGEKQIVELPKNVDTWAAGMLLILTYIVLTDN